MAKGKEMYSAMLLQLIQENVPGVFNPGGRRQTMTSLRVEQQPDAAWENFRAMGWNARSWSAIVREHEVLSGTVRLDFDQLDIILDMLCGAPVSNVVNAGVLTKVWELTDSGPVDRTTFTAQYGQKDAQQRLTHLLLMSLSLNFMRMTEGNEGNITLVGKKESEDLYPMVGLAPGNAVYTIDVADVDAPFTVTATDAAGAVLGDFDIAPADPAATVQTAARALGGEWSDVLVTLDGDTYSFEFVDDVHIPQPAVSNVDAIVGSTSAGSDGISTIPRLFPIMSQMWTLRHADTLAGLDTADLLCDARGFTMEFPDQISLLWHLACEDADVNELGFDSWVDNEYDLKMRITVANNTADSKDLIEGSKELPSRAEWWRAQAVHPDGIRKLQIDGLWAIEANVPYSNDNNVRYREFPFNVQLNEQGWVTRFTLSRPV